MPRVKRPCKGDYGMSAIMWPAYRGVFCVDNNIVRIEVQDRPEGLWREWFPPFEEDQPFPRIGFRE